MAETKKKTTETAAKAAPKTKTQKAKPVQDKPAEAVVEELKEPRQVYKVKQELDPHTLVTVKNGFQGRLIYIDRKTREEYDWEAFGDELELELGDLKYAKSSDKKFFINNWFIIEDPVIIEYLGLEQYYKNSLDIDGFESLFDKPAAEIKQIVAALPNGQKRSVMYKARHAIAEGAIDSLSVIKALEESLGVELIER